MKIPTSKIKDIIIELNNYTHRHLPSDFDSHDQYFIGRKEANSKLEDFITCNNSERGSYLLSGYRGMGKSSLVNNIIYKINHSIFNSVTTKQFLKILFYLILSFFFLKFLEKGLHIPEWVLLVFTILSYIIIFIYYVPTAKLNKRLYLNKFIFEIFYYCVYATFEIKKNTNSRVRNKILLCNALFIIIYSMLLHQHFHNIHEQKLLYKSYIISIKLYFTFSIINFLAHTFKKYLLNVGFIRIIFGLISYLIFSYIVVLSDNLWIHLICLLCVFLLYLLISILFGDYRKLSKNHGVKAKLRSVVNFFIQGDYISININLGQDNLSDLDVLKLLVKSTYVEYRKWFHSVNSIKKIGIKVIFVIVIFFISRTVFFHFTPFKNSIDLLLLKANYFNYFPSQVFRMSDGSECDNNYLALRDIVSADNNISFDKYLTILDSLSSTKRENKKITYYDTIIKNIKRELEEGSGNAFNKVVNTRFVKYILKVYNQTSANKLVLNDRYSCLHTLLFIDSVLHPDNRLPDGIDSIIKRQIETISENDLIGFENIFNKRGINYLLNLLDFSLQTSYIKLSEFLINIGNAFFTTSKWKLIIFPKRIDYFDLSVFFLFYILFVLAYYFLPFLSKHTNRNAIRILKKISNHIDAEISMDHTSNLPINKYFNFSIFRTQKMNYEKLDAKGIERMLIDFFDSTNNIPFITNKPRFIYIFDELDKIDPSHNVNISYKEHENLLSQKGKVENYRERQVIISKILSNLKFFLNTAKAKFIFITGREMYDAFLADVSDRESSIGNIFSDSLYINSFYSDPSDMSPTDITSMTEQYVCQFLFPENYYTEKKDLHSYYKYLVFYFGIEELKLKDNKKKEANLNDKNFDILINIECAKVILVISNFINYLTYRSNGSPKKIVTIFEDFVKSKLKKSKVSSNTIYVGLESETYYLDFDSFTQYKIGFSSYIFSPFLLSLSSHLHKIGDKILISTTYILDHLYKFHKYGFSWRNLELTPEILALNKAPELREYISEIVSFLSKNHIRDIISGLHEYKFNKKFSNEIEYISKVSETESAAFNFTLDESIEIKKYYRKRLNELFLSYNGKFTGEINYIHSVSFIHMILGDLHYYDQEYDDAIIQYMDAIQLLRNINSKDMTPYNFVILLRNMLKLGLTFERKKTYESAIMTYNYLCSMIIKIRDVDVVKLGYREFYLKYEELDYFVNKYYIQIVLNISSTIKYNLDNNAINRNSLRNEIIKTYFFKEKSDLNLFSEVQIIGRTNINSLATGILSLDFLSDFIGFAKDFFSSTLDVIPFTPEKSNIFRNISLQEGLKLFYQPIIARLHIIEKGTAGGLSYSDIIRADDEFVFIFNSTNKNEKQLVYSEYFNKTADILFYKNKILKDTESENSFDHYNRYLKSLLELLKRTGIAPIDLSKCDNEIELRQIICLTCEFILGYNSKDVVVNKSATFLNVFSNNISDLADSILSKSSDKIDSNENFDILIQLIEINNDNSLLKFYEIVKATTYSNKTLIAIVLLQLSSKVFGKFGNFYRQYIQQIKILQIIHELSPFKIDKLKTDLLLDKIEKIFLKQAIQSCYRYYGNSNRNEIVKLKSIFGISGNPIDEKKLSKTLLSYVYRNSLLATDLKEIFILFEKIKLGNNSKNQKSENWIQSINYSSINCILSRTHELEFYEEYLYDIFKNKFPLCYALFCQDENEVEKRWLEFKENLVNRCRIEEIDEIIQIIINSIYSLQEVINNYKIFGINYVNTTYGNLAKAHEYMAFWCNFYNLFSTDYSSIILKLKEVLGSDELSFINPMYHYEQALKNNNDVHKTHTEGDAYKELIKQYYYLDDDFDDSVLHFTVALERFKMNFKQFYGKIDVIRNILESQNLYKVEEYFY